MDCSICLTSTNKSTRSPVTCYKCDTTVCKSCIQQYLLQDATAEPACAECRTAWPQEFQVAHLTAKFRNGPLKAHRRAILIERERAQLPATMPNAVAYKVAREFIKEHDTHLKALTAAIYGCKEYKVLTALRDACDTEIRAAGTDFRDRIRYMNSPYYAEHKACIDAASAAWKTATKSERKDLASLSELLHPQRMIVAHYGHTDDAAHNQQLQQYNYKYKCVRDGCAGYLKDWNCELCETVVCSECREIKSGAVHTCDPLTVDSVSAIAAQAKPCPKCTTLISKVGGCDQMWCTQCRTAFSWTTGVIETAVIHNPHYYQWMRTQPAGLPPAGPAPAANCEAQILDAVEHTIAPYLTDTRNDERRVAAMRIFDLLRTIRHLEIIRLREMHQYLTFYNNPNWRRVLSVRYLVGELTETGWANALIQHHARYEHTVAEHALLTMYIQASKDILGQIVGSSDADKFASTYTEYQSLLTYVLDADEKQKKVYNSSGIGLVAH
jgi:hypothetical protein